MKDIKLIFKELEKFGILDQGHTNKSLIEHLTGTYKILKKWNCSEDLCLAGLCHSIYGTESYRDQTVPLRNRDFVRELIGEQAETLAYYFGALVKEHFWKLLDKNDNFEVKDRFTDEIKPLSKLQISALVTLTLANWLEQRPRVDEKFLYIRKEEFIASERFLPSVAYNDFKIAYQLD